MKTQNNEVQVLRTVSLSDQNSLSNRIKRHKAILILLIPGVVWYILFKYLPMLFAGAAFTDYGLKADLHFVGLENFQQLFIDQAFWSALRNTLILSFLNLLFAFPLPIILSICMNELMHKVTKRITQFIVYVPHFFSWVVVGALFALMLSPSEGIVNYIIMKMGGQSIYFMASPSWFRQILVVSGIWKDVGYGTVIYIATMATIDMELYDAATVDGSGYWGKLWHVTLPGLKSTIATVLLLTVARILLIFEQIYVMYNANVYDVSEVLNTLAYNQGLVNNNIPYATAISIFTALVSTILVIGCNAASKKFLGEEVI